MGDSPKNCTFIFFPEILSLKYPCLNSRRFENIAADVIIIVITSDVPEAFQSRVTISPVIPSLINESIKTKITRL